MGKLSNSENDTIIRRDISEIEASSFINWCANKPTIKIKKDMDFASVKGKTSSDGVSNDKMIRMKIGDDSSNSS